MIRFAKSEDFNRVLAFIKDYWRSDHVFVKNPDLMAWQHSESPEKDINFVLAESDEKIVAILGFIPFRRFDHSLDTDTVALAIWKRSDAAPPGTGVGMLSWLLNQNPSASVIAIGLNKATLPIYESLGFTSGKMSHFALFHPALSKSSITGSRILKPAALGSGLTLMSSGKEITEDVGKSITELLFENQPPKSLVYYRKRFEQHPWFDYQFLTLGRGRQATLLVVFRVVTVGNASVIRVVDIAGNLAELPNAASTLSDVVEHLGAEYLDILVSGAPDHRMVSSGFQSSLCQDDLVLPNYFDPFERRNVEVLYAFKTSTVASSHFHLHPADSDQDRPNQ